MFLELFWGCMLKLGPYAFLCLYVFRDCLKFSKTQTMWISTCILSLVCFIFSLSYYLPENFLSGYMPFTKTYLIFIFFRFICLLCYLYVVKEIWQKKIFIAIFTTICANVIYGIVTIVERFTRDSTENLTFLPFSPYAFFITALITTVTIPLALLLLNRLYVPVADSITPKESSYLCIVSILLYLLLRSEALSLTHVSVLNIQNIWFYLVLVITVYFTYLVIFKILFYAHEKLVAQEKYAHIRQQLALKEEQYHHIHENIHNNQRMRHDFRHHMVALQGFLNSDHIQKAEEYLSQFIQMLNDSMVVKFCENDIINMIAGYYQEIAKKRNIVFNVAIDLPKDIHIQGIDISVLLGNLLENAIQAAEYAKKGNRYIKLHMIQSGKMISITVDNGYQENLRKVDNQYLSTKVGHTGIGLQSVEHIAKKYNGGVEFCHDSTVFYSSVMLGVEG